MNVHKNARLTPIGRARIVLQVSRGRTPLAAARARWRLSAHGPQMGGALCAEDGAGLADRPSRKQSPQPADTAAYCRAA